VKDNRRQRLLLAALAVVAAVFAVVRLPSLLTPGGGGRGPGGGDGDGVGAARVAELEVGRLEAEARDYQPGRDPFRYYEPPPPPPPPPPPGPTAEELAALEAARLLALGDLPPPGPQLPAIDLTYLGSFGPEERPIAVLTNGDAIYNAVEGDVLEGRFVVAHIGYESVDLGYLEFPDEPPARLAVGG
jgi:hypothetical protein